ncbi:MAG: flagellar biosynthetic protein FliO [Rubrivivax sp.]|nr:flagellar biosynthetic protein FliO [Rubrivivax sp.]
MNWTSLLWFLAIVASIPLALWLARRSQLIGAPAIAGTARAVAVLPLSASQKVVTVELGRGDEKVWLVLGVTPSNITTLHTMSALAPIPATLPTPLPGAATTPPARGPAAATFAQLLGRLRGSAPGADHAH